MATPTHYLQITAEVITSPNILITDHSLYGMTGLDGNFYNVADIAWAMFVLDSDLTTILEYDTTNPANPSSWNYAGTPPGTYYFYVFAVGIYTIHSDYDAGTNGCIVFYNGSFYQQIADSPAADPDRDPSSWALIEVGSTDFGAPLTLATCFNKFWVSIHDNLHGVSYGSTSASLSAGTYTESYFEMTKTSCHNWHIDSTIGTGDTVQSATIYDYTGLELSTLTADSLGDYDIELDADGAFIVEIEVLNAGGTDVYYLTIFDFCNAENCFQQLFKYVKCKCTNPCDADCRERELIDQRRNDMILIRGLLDDIKAKVFMTKTKFIGVFAEDDERQNYVETVGRSIVLLNEIVARCGACGDQTNDVSC